MHLPRPMQCILTWFSNLQRKFNDKFCLIFFQKFVFLSNTEAIFPHHFIQIVRQKVNHYQLIENHLLVYYHTRTVSRYLDIYIGICSSSLKICSPYPVIVVPRVFYNEVQQYIAFNPADLMQIIIFVHG